jgi:hypothetical protein
MSSARKCFPNCHFETVHVRRRQGERENTESNESCCSRTGNNCVFEKTCEEEREGESSAEERNWDEG